jgi:ubiquinone/menaquinone biosynthesis C-methylase UbiE
MLSHRSYQWRNPAGDPMPFYYWPVLGRLYRRRVELCLAECAGGERVLEVGFGSGVSFLNLHEMYREIHGVDLTAAVESVTEAFKARGVPAFLRRGDVRDLPYPEGHFDTVLLISILEHLKPGDLDQALGEISRVLKPGGQMVYGVPVERPFMVFMFRLLGYDIRQHHFSTEDEVRAAAARHLTQVRVTPLKPWVPLVGAVYEVGHFVKAGAAHLVPGSACLKAENVENSMRRREV